MKMIDVGKSGKFYTLNGVVTPPDKFYGVDGFKFVNHIWGWVTAGRGTAISGGQHMSNARRYIEQDVLALGCRRMRAPVELCMWGWPYFDQAAAQPAPYNLSNVANTAELVNIRSGVGSGFNLTDGMRKVIRMFVRLAREYEIIIEIPWLWTIKSTASDAYLVREGIDDGDPRARFEGDNGESGVSVWNEHFMAARGVGAYLHQLRTIGDRGVPDDVPGVSDSAVLPGPLNLIHDVMNEYTAHVPTIWTEKQQRDVVRRMRERDCPFEEAVLLSQSGRADRYDPPLQSQHGNSGYSGPCLHPPRNLAWAMTGAVMRRTWLAELIDVNESQLGLTQEQRNFWVPLIPKWAGLGSTDMSRWRRMHENFIHNDIYTTFHNFRGMDAGWPATPQTVVEETIRSITGAVVVRPPTPPPTPPTPPEPPIEPPKVPLGILAFRRIIAPAYIAILNREPDVDGLVHYNALMRNGVSEANMREMLIRSDEYADAHSYARPPEPPAPPPPTPDPPTVPTKPPSSTQPSDYISIERAGIKGTTANDGADPGTGLLAYLRHNDQIWTIRNFAIVIANGCDFTSEPFNIYQDDLDELRREGAQLQWGRNTETEAAVDGIVHPCYESFYGSDGTMDTGRLTKVNRRCSDADDNPDGYCGRTDVAKSAFAPWRTAWEDWRERAHEIDSRDPDSDGIRDWCNKQL